MELKNSRLGKLSLIFGLFLIAIILEFCTPSEYIFGYLYTVPILLANTIFKRFTTWKITVVAVILTLLNLWIPGTETIGISSLVNRLIAAIALIVTGILSVQNQHYQKALTEQKIKLQSQEKLAELREDFASTLTHDLKTPLLGAIETVQAFQEGKFGVVSSTQKQVLSTMNRSHQSSLKLVETLLDIYRNDTEGLQLQIEPLDLTNIAEDAINNLRELAATRQIHISLNYGPSEFRRSLWVQGDILQLQRVLTNLLINAINYSRRGGKVEVILESQTAYQIVKILDTGPGITATELPHLFERFYQGHSQRSYKGTGLGLYLARQIIDAHNGIIWAENRRSFENNLSEHPSGAIFGFKLPVYPYFF
jgi:two-component system NarL family sensor kinase